MITLRMKNLRATVVSALLLMSQASVVADDANSKTFVNPVEGQKTIRVIGEVSLPPMLGIHLLGRRVAIPARRDVLKNLSEEETVKVMEELKEWNENLPSNTILDGPLQDYGCKMSVRAIPVPYGSGSGIVDGAKSKAFNEEILVDIPVILETEEEESNLVHEYYDLVVAFSGRVELRRSLKSSDLLNILNRGEDSLRVTLDLRSTVESAFFRELGSIHEIDMQLEKSVQEVVEEASSLMLTKSYSRRSIRNLVHEKLLSVYKNGEAREESFLQSHGNTRGVAKERQNKDSRSLITLTAANACNSATPAAICYEAKDEVVYNLVAYKEMFASTSMGLNLFEIPFSAFPGSPITTQYSASKGVIFSWPTSGLVEEQTGYATLHFPTSTSVLRIEFPSSILSFGFKLVDGGDFLSPVKAYPRRAFRITMFDATGQEIHQYRWYVAHRPGFYGATLGRSFSNSYIQYIEISVEEAGHLAMKDLIFSTVNVATTYVSGRRATGGALTLNDNLGWRARGNWRRDLAAPAPSTSYYHPWKGDTYRSGESGGTFWRVKYKNGRQPNVLMSPAFTLSNLPVWSDKDDDYSKWNIGLSASTGATPSELSQARIPTNYFTSSCTCTTFADWCCFFDQTSTPTMETWTFHESIAAMHSHWSHAHFSSNADIDPASVITNNPGKTERWVEYSVDNGHTWKKNFWYEDISHRGSPSGGWHMCHMHAFTDSDLSAEVYGEDHNGDTSATGVWTDFDKDGVKDYTAFDDWDLDGKITNDREWDTEFYLSHVNNPASTASASLCSTTRTSLTFDTYQFCISELEAPSIMYRFRFVGRGYPNCPTVCHRTTASGVTTCGNCRGWSVDDVAFSNDDSDQGYYTNFDGSYDSSFA